MNNRDSQANLVSHLNCASDSLLQLAAGRSNQPAATQIRLALQAGRKLSQPTATSLRSQRPGPGCVTLDQLKVAARIAHHQ
jgi:hypothetical protein